MKKLFELIFLKILNFFYAGQVGTSVRFFAYPFSCMVALFILAILVTALKEACEFIRSTVRLGYHPGLDHIEARVTDVAPELVSPPIPDFISEVLIYSFILPGVSALILGWLFYTFLIFVLPHAILHPQWAFRHYIDVIVETIGGFVDKLPTKVELYPRPLKPLSFDLRISLVLRSRKSSEESTFDPRKPHKVLQEQRRRIYYDTMDPDPHQRILYLPSEIYLSEIFIYLVMSLLQLPGAVFRLLYSFLEGCIHNVRAHANKVTSDMLNRNWFYFENRLPTPAESTWVRWWHFWEYSQSIKAERIVTILSFVTTFMVSFTYYPEGIAVGLYRFFSSSFPYLPLSLAQYFNTLGLELLKLTINKVLHRGFFGVSLNIPDLAFLTYPELSNPLVGFGYKVLAIFLILVSLSSVLFVFYVSFKRILKANCRFAVFLFYVLLSTCFIFYIFHIWYTAFTIAAFDIWFDYNLSPLTNTGAVDLFPNRPPISPLSYLNLTSYLLRLLVPAAKCLIWWLCI